MRDGENKTKSEAMKTGRRSRVGLPLFHFPRVGRACRLLADPEREFYMRELSRETKQAVGSVQRELVNLEEMNLVVSRRQVFVAIL